MEGILFTILLASTGLVGVRGETCDRNSLSLVDGCLVPCADGNTCLTGQSCAVNEDCKDKNDICVDSSTMDGLKCRNCNETLENTGQCRNGADCNENSQCLSKVCSGGVCLDNCVDEQICSLGQPCRNDNENCKDVNLVCKTDDTATTTCQVCQSDCRIGAICTVNADCESNRCVDGLCVVGCEGACGLGEQCEVNEDCFVDFNCYLSPSEAKKDNITRCIECNKTGDRLCREGAKCESDQWCNTEHLIEGEVMACSTDPNDADRTICTKVQITTPAPTPTEAPTPAPTPAPLGTE